MMRTSPAFHQATRAFSMTRAVAILNGLKSDVPHALHSAS
jgi:hypothetical protein